MSIPVNKLANTILPPTMVLVQSAENSGVGNNPVQISAHKVTSKSFMREAQYVFPNIDLKDVIVIHTMQHAATEMVSFGEEVENEKDRLTLTVRVCYSLDWYNATNRSFYSFHVFFQLFRLHVVL